MTPTGWVVVRDALVFGARSEDDVVTPHSRPPTSYDAGHLLVRTMRCTEGFTQVDLVCEPVFDYGREPATCSLVDGSRHQADATGAGTTVRLHSDLALGVEGPRVRARGLLREGEEVFCALSWAGDLGGPEDARRAQEALDTTTQYWRMWLARARIPDHRYPEHIERSVLAINGLTYMPTGATIAALTTSLPETLGGERNWEYRYTWVRDATFTL